MYGKVDGLRPSLSRMRVYYSIINLDVAVFRIGHPAAPRRVGLRRWLAWKADGAVFWAIRRLNRAESRLLSYALYGRWEQ